MDSIHSKWVLPIPVDIPTAIEDLIGGDRLVGAALVRRGLTDFNQARAFIDPSFYVPANPSDLPDLDKAVERILFALRHQQRIGIWGDFDVDGQTSTTLLVSALRLVGADVKYHIPVRAVESHGITLPRLQEFVHRGLDLVVTCDTGITAFDAAIECRRLGVDLIITDHHTPGEGLPEAFAVVNPQRLPPGRALSYLCGVGCAFQIIRRLYHELGQDSKTDQFLDLVAMGTVADVALLKGDNRYLVQKGLQQVRTNPRPALKAILSLAETQYTRLTEEHIGFVLGPRMNAIGRLSDANPMVEFLLADQPDYLANFALKLESLNNDRKLQCDQVFKAALSQVESNRSLLDDPILVLSHPEWPAGIVGIVASRLVELYQRPCILLVTPPEGPARGSARSVEGINITRAIAAQKELLIGFGGHPMAAGLSLQIDRISEFRKSLSRFVRDLNVDPGRAAAVQIDAFVPLQDISMPLVESISKLAPFGAGNDALILAASRLHISARSIIGKTGEHLKLVVEDSSGTATQVIWWQGAGSPMPEGEFNLAYRLSASDFKGSPQLQVEWIDYEDSPVQSITLSEVSTNLQWEDYRITAPSREIWENILAQKPAIWAEGRVPPGISTANRVGLQPNQLLVVWSIPPGPREFKQALDAVRPARILLLGHASTLDKPADFLRELSGMALFSVNKKGGWFEISRAAAACGQRTIAVRLGIKCLCANGQLQIIRNSDPDRFQLALSGSFTSDLDLIDSDLGLILKETDAYRQYYLRARPDLIISAAQKYSSP